MNDTVFARFQRLVLKNFRAVFRRTCSYCMTWSEVAFLKWWLPNFPDVKRGNELHVDSSGVTRIFLQWSSQENHRKGPNRVSRRFERRTHRWKVYHFQSWVSKTRDLLALNSKSVGFYITRLKIRKTDNHASLNMWIWFS
jgi:hypothetical protein